MSDRSQAPLPRRLALKGLLAIGGGLATGVGLAHVRALSAQTTVMTASGAGVNVKQMPSPDGGATVPLRESFAFDATYAQCIIEDNAAPILMDTFAMGKVVIEPHQFFMAMYANEVSIASIERRPGDTRVAKLVGVLDCSTFAGTAGLSLGARTQSEPATYEIEATDGGHGGGVAGDRFVFQVFFDPTQAPVNYAIFGPNPSFTGEMVAGEITIGPPIVRPVT